MKKNIFVLILIFLFPLLLPGATTASEKIKVGVPLCLTGPYASDGLSLYRGIKLAIDEINQTGGILGKQLEIVKFDTHDLAPERVIQAAYHLAVSEKVDVIHGGWAGWGQDVRAYGKYDMPFFMWDSSSRSIEVIREDPVRYSNVFQLNDVDRNLAIDMFNMMNNLPVQFPNKKIAIITADDSWSIDSGSGMNDHAIENGWDVVIYETVPYGTRNWMPILTKIRKAAPEIIYVEIVSSSDLVTFFSQFMEMPTKSLINLGYGLTLPGFIENLGIEANGLLGASTSIPLPVAPTPEAQSWIDRYQQTYQAEPTAGSFAVYTGVMIWAETVHAVGRVEDYASICKYLKTASFNSLDGKAVKFDSENKIPLASWPRSHFQVQNGELITIYYGPKRNYLNYRFQMPPWME